MIALTNEQLKTIISTADNLHSLVGVNNLSYPELVAIQDEIVSDLIENAMPIPEDGEMGRDLTTVVESSLATIDTGDMTKSEKLDDDMFSLANKIVGKLDLLVSVAYQPHELVTVVETLTTLRGAFYDKGPTIQVNTQNNNGGGDESTGEVKRFKGLLKR